MCSDSPLDVIGERVLLGGGEDNGKIVTVGGELLPRCMKCSQCTPPKKSTVHFSGVLFQTSMHHFFIHMFIFLNVNFTSIC